MMGRLLDDGDLGNLHRIFKKKPPALSVRRRTTTNIPSPSSGRLCVEGYAACTTDANINLLAGGMNWRLDHPERPLAAGVGWRVREGVGFSRRSRVFRGRSRLLEHSTGGG
jgi:hypothetical protein